MIAKGHMFLSIVVAVSLLLTGCSPRTVREAHRVVASDSTGLYQEQSRICEITYDSVFVEEQERKMPFNGFVTADFVLSQ